MKFTKLILASLLFVSCWVAPAHADLPAFDKVSEGYEKVAVSDMQNPKGLFNIWQRKKDGQIIGCLLYTSPSPRDRG